ncbi:MAG: hypothetical protein KZQ66_19140 [Candidatus Thiodiazotropha sp. (ex Lucinoma aequizonata)]|nr:hypothetical protein [Candidatus Thiodiazotropha sp. (ex Lucinoma aequizonata)]
MGFIAADFSLDKVVADENLIDEQQQWQEFKGDPAVRATLFMQQRIQNRLDENIDSVNETIYDLITQVSEFKMCADSDDKCNFLEKTAS